MAAIGDVKAEIDLRNAIFPFLDWILLEFENIYVLNLKNGRPKKTFYVVEFAASESRISERKKIVSIKGSQSKSVFGARTSLSSN